MDAYVDKEDYFDKYFEMGTILTIFFLQINYFGLKLHIHLLCSYLTSHLMPRCYSINYC